MDGPASLAFARACVAAANLGDRVDVRVDDGNATLLLIGPDQFGLMGTTVYVTVRVALPATERGIALAAARHVFAEFHAADDEIATRAHELPLALAMAIAP